jgi:hypothetical protein
LQHLGPRPARDIRVVEDDSRCPGGERPLETAGQRPQRAACLVAIDPVIAVGDEPLGQRCLAGARQAHDDDNLGVVSRRRRDDPITTQQARRGKRVIEQLSVGGGQHDVLCAR